MQYTIDIFSPRWGHTDPYEVVMEQDTLTFQQVRGNWPAAVLTDVPDRDPVWNDVNNIWRMLANDHIYPTEKLPDMLEYVWRAWRNGDLQGDDVQAELDELAEFVNATTRAKPRTQFWKSYF